MVRFSMPLALSSSCRPPWAFRWWHVPCRSAHWPVILNVVHHRLAHILAETFVPTVLLYGMVGHYSQGLPLIHCDIPPHFTLGKQLFWCKCAAQLGLLPSCTTLTAWLISRPRCATTSYHRAICCSAYTLCLQTFHMTHICLWSFHIYPRNKIVAMTYAPTLVYLVYCHHNTLAFTVSLYNISAILSVIYFKYFVICVKINLTSQGIPVSHDPHFTLT